MMEGGRIFVCDINMNKVFLLFMNTDLQSAKLLVTENKGNFPVAKVFNIESGANMKIDL